MARTTAASNFILLVLVYWWSAMLVEVVFCDTHGDHCIATEREALLQFKLGLHDPQGKLDTWTTSSTDDCCSGWRGVGCDDQTGHIVELDLRGMNLGVTRGCEKLHQPTLCRLTRLQRLDFSSNNFKNCSIPSFVGCFKELRYLNLSTSYFHGIVPSSLGNLSNLVQLDLSKNLSNLVEVDLSKKIVSGSIFDEPYGLIKIHDARWFRQLLSLEYIDMSYSQLENSSSQWIQSLNKLPFLSKLICSHCKIERFPKSLLLHFPSLQILDLSHCQLQGHIPAFIESMLSLRKLTLSFNKFNGSIPSFIENFSLLQYLDLSFNKFNGPIPSFIGNLSSLQHLDFSHNNIIGSIPTSFGNLSSLKHLDLSFNNISGSIPTFLENLSTLQHLVLSFNKFNGSIPKSLCNLSLLETLAISGNDNINGVDFPKCFGGLSKLMSLTLEGHGFILSESHFVNMSQLAFLSLQSNLSSTLNISSSNWVPPFSLQYLSIQSWRVNHNVFPSWIHTQEKVQSLRLKNVCITGNLPAWIWNFSSSLSILNVASNDMVGEIPNATNSNSALQMVDLSSNKFEGSNWLSTISRMTPTLSSLSLSNNANLFGGISLLLCEVQNLRVLDLSKNNFFGEIPNCLMKVKDILHLGSNRFNGTIPSIQENQCTLKVLQLESNELYGSLPSSLSKCRNLIILDLHENKLNGLIPSWIAESMLSLKILNLRSNIFFGNISHTLSRLESLHVLDLGNNNLSGLIPKTIGDFKAMRVVHKSIDSIVSNTYGLKGDNYHFQVFVDYKENVTLNTKGREYSYSGNVLSLVTKIDLSKNNLSGVIPKEFGDLLGLSNINLSANQLKSTIPKTLSSLLWLETLDLSRNELFGQIPQEMTKMTSLSYFNLSLNNLSGKIPTGNQFLTFRNVSYIGNPNLCGPPLSKNCVEGQNRNPKSENKDDDDETEELWLYMTGVFGFIVGFWTFYGIFFFKKTWRYPYLQFLSDTSLMLYTRIIQPIRRMVK